MNEGKSTMGVSGLLIMVLYWRMGYLLLLLAVVAFVAMYLFFPKDGGVEMRSQEPPLAYASGGGEEKSVKRKRRVPLPPGYYLIGEKRR